MGGHGGMDFIMRYRIIECLIEGLPLDQNVYEGCFLLLAHLVENLLKKRAHLKNSLILQEEIGNLKPLDIIS